MAKKYDKEQLKIDWSTGEYTMRSLAHKHKVSAATVSNIVNGLEKNLEVIINKKVNAEQEIAKLNEQEVNTVNEHVNRKIEDSKMIRALTKNNMVGVAAKLKNHKELDMLAHKNAQDLIDKASITLGINQRHAPKSETNINNTNENTQQTAVKVIKLVAG